MTASKNDLQERADDTLSSALVDGSDDVDSAAPAVLLLGIEPATAGLFDEWLTRDGLRVLQQARPRTGTHERVALIVIDLAFPRRDGARQLHQLAQAWPGVPVLALSSTFLPGVAAQGEVARQLGAAAVLAAPVARDALRGAVAQLLQGARLE
jgi:CheY-like chemotaxis protein